MSITLRNTCVAILLFASIPWQSCFGWISLCSHNASFSHNGTSVIAEIGQPASVSFCVDTDNEVHSYFKIQHSRVGTDWFLNSTKGRITTQFVKDKTKAIITITINPVKQEDFLDKFYLTVYRVPGMDSGNLQLWFQLENKEDQIWSCSSHDAISPTVEVRLGESANVTLCAETNGTFQPNISIHRRGLPQVWYEGQQIDNGPVYVIISQNATRMNINITIRNVTVLDLNRTFNVTVYITNGKGMTELFELKLKDERNTEDGVKPTSHSLTQATHVFPPAPSATVTTQVATSENVRDITTSTTSRCLPYANSGCPESWYPVHDYRCIRLFPRIKNVYATKLCSDVGVEVLETKEITELKTCLEYLLENTTLKIVRSQGNNYNVLTGMKVQKQSDYNVVCRVNKTKTELDQVTTISSPESTSQSMTSKTPSDLTDATNTTANTQPTSSAKSGEAAAESSTTQASPSTSYTSTVSSSTGGHRCLSKVNSGCPENMHPVDDHRCLILSQPHGNVNSEVHCKGFGGKHAKTRDITELMACLDYFLENTPATFVRFSQSQDIFLNTTKASKGRQIMIIACIVDKSQLVSPAINEFYVESMDGYRKRKNNLLIGSREAKLDVTNSTLAVVCIATGLPSLEVTLARDNITLTDFNGSSLLIRKPDCGNSGLYTCHARNFLNFTRAQAKIQFQSPIKINPITFTNRRTGSTRIQSGDDVSVNCSVTGCPYPDVLTLSNEVNLTLSAFVKSSVIHEMTRVQCSDMGAYHCRVEAEDLEDRRDLLVQKCPIQLCRAQEDSVTISRNVNQTTSLSVCLMSDERPTWENIHGSKSISVVFTRRSGGGIYFSARINISNIEDGDNNVSIIVMKNRHGSLNYSIKLQSVESREGPLGGHTDPSLSDQSNMLPIYLPLVLIVVIVAAVVALVMYRHKVKRGDRRASSVRKVLSSSDSGNDESGQAMYANFRELATGNPSQDTQTTHVEDGMEDNCGDNELSSYITDEDSGRFVSDEGLVYLTVVDIAKKLKKKPKEAKQKPKQAANNIDDHVEYLTLDFEKTGKFLIPDESELEKAEQEASHEETGEAKQ